MPAFLTLVGSGPQKRRAEVDEVPRKRLALDRDLVASNSSVSENSNREERYWMVQWRNPQYKKHKTWDGDAVLVENGVKGTLYDPEGKTIGAGKLAFPVSKDKENVICGKEFEVDHEISRKDYLSGLCFGRISSSPSHSQTTSTTVLSKPFVPPTRSSVSGPQLSRQPESAGRRGIPFMPVDMVAASQNNQSEAKDKQSESHWTANWRKIQQKKHKTWDGDAFVSQVGDKLIMISEEGKILGSTAWKGDTLHCGFKTYIAGKEVELDNKISASQLPDTIAISKEREMSFDVSPQRAASYLQEVAIGKGRVMQPLIVNSSNARSITPASFYGTTAKAKPKLPLHDPEAEGAVVMKAPTKEHMMKFNQKNLLVVPVVLDPILARRMRPHQKEGVKFLYECVMGLRKHEGQGCILADEMGLGKTLQTVSLIWTLLKQNPYAGAKPVIGKAMIVCPVSVVNNWKVEFHKWLGRDRIGVFIGDKDKSKIKHFVHSKVHQVLIIGYERLRTVCDDLMYCDPPIGLIVCDEGHRLKSGNNKTTTTLKAFRTLRRIILSGTPIQNDLGEFHAMADFCNPGLLEDYATFRRIYESPILKSRAPDCSARENEIGSMRSEQLLEISRSFVLRRNATILKNYLPPKYEYVVFVTPTALQLNIFAKILNADKLDNLMQSSTAESLALINLLTKISNSPILLKATADRAKKQGKEDGVIRRSGVDDALELLPERVQVEDMSLSGKLTAISTLLQILRENTEEKCILVSHYTSTLNILEAFCKKKSYTYYRLDGQTPASKRQEYINIFNKSSQRSRFVFLLSSKAGGVGVNLIGASRLCLIDSDWNPSHDLQSMARIHRDGQKRPVFIYRFLTAGTIDEKIYQRQVTKLGLSESLIGSGTSSAKSDSFTRKDLRDIFRIHPDTVCNTHDLLQCPCEMEGDYEGGEADEQDDENNGDNDDDNDDDIVDADGDWEELDTKKGFMTASHIRPERARGNNKTDKAYLQKKKAELAALGEWTHINCLRPSAKSQVQDDILRQLIFRHVGDDAEFDVENEEGSTTGALAIRDVPGGTVSFLFEKSSTNVLEAEAGDDES